MLSFSGCKKGGRECEFPQTTSSSKRAKQSQPRSPQDGIKPDSQDQGLETIKDESEDEEFKPKTPRRPTLNNVRTHSAQSVSRKQKRRQGQDISPTLKERQSPQSTTSSSPRSRTETSASSLPATAKSAEIQARQAKIKALKPDIQKYLQFQLGCMTHYHYFFKLDPFDFVHTEFIDQALSFEPLLYAAVGFAAYHYELQQPNAKLSHFLGYHSKALSMLRRSLESHTQYTEAMLLTVLQLATLEEYMGDWVNLVGHHRAAHTMLLQLFEPEPMMETELGRCIFSWYSRFDIVAGLMSGNETQLDRVWFEANSNWYHSQVDDDPQNDLDLDGILADLVASNRLLGSDMATLYARLSKGAIPIDEFHTEHQKIIDRLNNLKGRIESTNDEHYTVQHFPQAENRPLTDEDIVNPYRPGGLFRDALWSLNFMWIDWYSIEQMSKYQAATLLQEPISTELEALSLEQCRIYEAIDRWPDAPAGALLGCHASLGLTCVFLQKDEKHIMWSRRKPGA
jgi:Fungal specific transcription factor domain